MKASLLRPAAVPASARAAPARAIGAATSGPDRRRRRLFQSLAAAARRRLIVSSVVTLSRRHVVSVRARSSGDDEEGNEDFEDDEEFDEDDLLAEFGEDFEGDDEFADDDTTPVEESASRAEASKQQKKQQQPSSAAADEEEEVTERRQDQEKKAKKKKQSSDSEKQSKSKSDASASAADGSSPSTSSLPPAPVRGDAARAYAASAAARAAAGASSASSASDEGEVLEQEEESFSEGDGEEGYGGDDFGDERTDRALAEAERALQEFLQSGKKDSSSAKGDKKKSKPELLNADLAARALDATAASGDDPKFRAGAGIPDDPFAPREEFDEATGKVKVVPGLPPPRRWLRRVADQGPFDTAKWAVREIKARIDHERAVPFIGNAYISYARLLELLSTRTVTKLTILAGGRCAIVETPVVGFAVDMSYAAAEPGAKEFTALQGTALPQWGYEVTRFYCDLPGDVWEQGTLMRLVKDAATPKVQEGGLVIAQDQPYLWDAPQTELVVRPPESAFLFITQNKGLAVPIAALLGIRTALVIGGRLVKLLFPRGWGKKAKDQEEIDDLLGELGRTSAIQFNVDSKGGKAKDSGVRYSNVAGIDSVLSEIKEVVAMLLQKDQRYEEIGANPPRGIIFAGPPGTGKTLLARAMAGEAGVPFFACSGSEFVEMYSGVAAARIRDLFKLARKVSPSIIFIDEIDAIARSRTLNAAAGGGAMEREQGLLQLLVEMDGFERNDRVLVIGATNLVESMDAAILRPGRFGKIIRLDPPRIRNRWEILRVHAQGKPLDRSGDDVVERATGERADALLWRAAKKTKGWSGAELANLMNESAILMVRYNKDQIDWEVMAEALEKRDLTSAPTPPPRGEAGKRLALIHAARAVASAITPGFPRIDGVGIDGRGEMVARIKFDAVDYFRSGDGSVRLLFGPRPHVDVVGRTDEDLASGSVSKSDEDLAEERASALRLPAGVTALPASDEALEEVWSYRGRGPRGSGAPGAVEKKVSNAAAASAASPASFAPPTAYEAACGLLVPLLTARAAEAVFFGAAEGTTLASAREVAAAGDLGFWLATTSNMHPARARSSPAARFLPTETGEDSLTRYARSQGEGEAARLQRIAYERAKRVLRRWRPAVEEMATAMLEAPNGSLEGEAVAAILARNVPPPPGARLPGSAAVGGIRFLRALGAGRPGIAVFGSAAASRSFAHEGPAKALEEWSAAGLDLSDEACVAAIEAVAGALSGQDLTAAGLSSQAKSKLAKALQGTDGENGAEEAEMIKKRLAAVRAYVSSAGEGDDEPPFPPPPVGKGFVPPEAGEGSLASWIPELAGPGYASQTRGKGLWGFPKGGGEE